MARFGHLSRHRFAGALCVLSLAAALSVVPATGPSPQAAADAFSGRNGAIAFRTWRNFNPEIYSMSPDGTGTSRLTLGSATTGSLDDDPAWSPSGRRIAYLHAVYTSTGQLASQGIWVMRPDGSGKAQLTYGRDAEPTWSPDGTRLAFLRQTTTYGPFDLWVMDADGTNRTRLTATPESETGPTWSPDGTRIAYARSTSMDSDLWVITPDGSSATNLTQTMAVIERDPSWSPDGSHLAFSTGSDIYTITDEGTERTRLTTNPAEDVHPSWSPDGTRIAFSSTRDAPPGFPAHEIYVMNADGTGQTRLTVNDHLAKHPDDVHPSWQPDPTAPEITIEAPVEGQNVSRGATVIARYSCRDRESGIARCAGPVPAGAAIDTSTLGPHAFEVIAKDRAGGRTTATVTYVVQRVRPDGIVRLAGGTSVGDGLYNTTGEGQRMIGSARPGSTVTFEVFAQNDGSITDRFKVRGWPSSDHFTVTYLEGATDVTAAVTGGTYVTAPIGPGASSLLTVRVKVRQSAPLPSSISGNVTVSSQFDPTKRDVVITRVVRSP